MRHVTALRGLATQRTQPDIPLLSAITNAVFQGFLCGRKYAAEEACTGNLCLLPGAMVGLRRKRRLVTPA